MVPLYKGRLFFEPRYCVTALVVIRLIPYIFENEGAIAKWLRRQIRNLFLFEGAGSNPAGVAIFLLSFSYFLSLNVAATMYILRRIEIVHEYSVAVLYMRGNEEKYVNLYYVRTSLT